MNFEDLMLSWSIISSIFINLMCFFQEKIINKMPSIIKIFLRNNNKESYNDNIPSIPKKPLIIWKLSQLEYSLKEIEKKYANDLESKNKYAEEIIRQAKELTGTGQINAEILHKFPEFLEIIDKNSILSRIKGFFNFVNIIWLIAIFGIILSIGPSLSYLFSPIMQFIVGFYFDKIYPIIIKLYENGFFEIFAFYVSITLIADGMKVNKEYGFFISLTGSGLYYYLILYHGFNKEITYSWNDSDYIKKYLIIKGILIMITFFSLSVYFNSKIFSFITIISFYYLLGFYTGCFGLCYAIGFKDDNSMIKIITTSFLLLLIYILIRGLNFSNKIIELYRSPIQIFGTLTYFLGILIISSIFYDSFELSYALRQIIFVVSNLVVLFFGNFYNLPSMTNTAYVFGVLYLMEKNVDLFMKIKGNVWVLVFILSSALWAISLYLHKNSKIVISIFKGI